MAETENIAKIANKVSGEVFSAFGWRRVAPKNENWKCIAPKEHKTQGGTHPSDVVFAYEDPYDVGTTYVNTDLKSYAKDTISADKVGGALRRLGMATECANGSEDFARLFVANEETTKWNVVGLLFVYNHDGEYDSSFQKLVGQVDEKAFALASRRRMFFFGPKEIEYLYNIAHDLDASRGKKQVPAVDQCSFFYPDLVRTKSRTGREAPAASLEWLSSPWQIIRFGLPIEGTAAVQQHSWVYYRGPGTSTDEFKYLIDFLFRYQLVEPGNKIHVRTVPSLGAKAADVAAVFAKAKVEYAAASHPADREEFERRLTAVDVSMMPSVITRFDDTELGMGDA